MNHLENEHYSVDKKFKSDENSKNIKQELQYEILTQSEIKNRSEKTAEHLSILFQINLLNSINYLIKNSWNLENAIDDLMSYKIISSQNSFDYTFDSNYANHKVCLKCYNSNEDLISLDCLHHFCKVCLYTYLTDSISQGLDTTFLNCPIPSCQNIVPLYLVQLLLEIYDFEAFGKFIISSYVGSQSHIKWCPGENCTNAAISFINNPKEILCSCEHFWCFECGEESHRPVSCELLARFRKKIEKHRSLVWIEENTKKCPRCNINIERNEGCLKVTCNCSCKFCWNCLNEWSYHENSSFIKCQRYLRLYDEFNDTNINSFSLEFKKSRFGYFIGLYSDQSEDLIQSKKLFLKDEKFLQNNITNLLSLCKLNTFDKARRLILRCIMNLKHLCVYGCYIDSSLIKLKFLVFTQTRMKEVMITLRKFIENVSGIIDIESLDRFEAQAADKIETIQNFFDKSLTDFEENMPDIAEGEMINQNNYQELTFLSPWFCQNCNKLVRNYLKSCDVCNFKNF